MILKDAAFTLIPFDLEPSLGQTVFLFAGKITTSGAIEAEEADVYRGKVEEVVAQTSRG